MKKEEFHIHLHCTDFPGIGFMEGYSIFVGVQKKQEILDAVRGDSSEARFHVQIGVAEGKDGTPNFLGPYVFGKTGDKFLYLTWYAKKAAQEERFRRAKIKLNVLSWKQIRSCIENHRPLIAHIKMTDHRGEPICASLKESHIRWDTSD